MLNVDRLLQLRSAEALLSRRNSLKVQAIASARFRTRRSAFLPDAGRRCELGQAGLVLGLETGRETTMVIGSNAVKQA
jgi:hypothetical protein